MKSLFSKFIFTNLSEREDRAVGSRRWEHKAGLAPLANWLGKLGGRPHRIPTNMNHIMNHFETVWTSQLNLKRLDLKQLGSKQFDFKLLELFQWSLYDPPIMIIAEADSIITSIRAGSLSIWFLVSHRHWLCGCINKSIRADSDWFRLIQYLKQSESVSMMNKLCTVVVH